VWQRVRALVARDDLDERLRRLEEGPPAPDPTELRAELEELAHRAVDLNQSVLARRLDLIDAAVDELRHGLVANRQHTEDAVSAVHVASIDAAREHTEAAVEVSAQKLGRRIDILRRSQQAATAAPPPPAAPGAPAGQSPAPAVDPGLYAALEEQFRGEPQMIEERQRVYLPHLAGVVDAEHPVLDLGCGRGEWLRILAEQGLPARGVDSSPVFVAECTEAGLDVVEGDLVAHLTAQPPGSLGAITLFQVVEHLPFGVLVATLSAAAGALRPGGVLIAETPNATNLAVGASSFWIDPTHERPLHPEVLVFLAHQCGFDSTERLFVNRLGPPVPDVSGLGPPAADLLVRLTELVDGPGDFALVARTPARGADAG
jgi:SAM-dependent methyltransferase